MLLFLHLLKVLTATNPHDIISLSTIKTVKVQSTWTTYDITETIDAPVVVVPETDNHFVEHVFPEVDTSVNDVDISTVDIPTFNSSHGLLIYNLPSYGNGLLNTLTFYVLDPGIITIYILKKPTNCSLMSELWMCSASWWCPSLHRLYNCSELGDICEENGSEIKDRYLADMFVISNSFNITLIDIGLQTFNLTVPIEKDSFVAMSTLSANLRSYSHDANNFTILEFSSYSTGIVCSYNPFVTVTLLYLTTQVFTVSFNKIENIDSDIMKTFSGIDEPSNTISFSIDDTMEFVDTVMEINFPGWIELISINIPSSWISGRCSIPALSSEDIKAITNFTSNIVIVSPKNYIICLSNCNNESITTTSGMLLKANLTDIPYRQLSSIRWKLYSYQSKDDLIEPIVKTNSGISISLKTHLLTQSSNYILILEITKTNGKTLTSLIYFRIVPVLYITSCFISPSNGTAIETEYSFNCSVTGDGAPCPHCDGSNNTFYKFCVQQCHDIDCEVVKPLLSLTSDVNSGERRLAVGFKELEYTAIIKVIVTTNEDVFIQTAQFTTVSMPNDFDGDADAFLDLFLDVNSTFQDLLANSTIPALNYLNSALPLRNNLSGTNTVNTALLFLIDQITVTIPEEAEHKLSVIEAITSDTNNINSSSALLSLSQGLSLYEFVDIESKGEHIDTINTLLFNIVDNVINTNANLSEVDVVPNVNFILTTDAPGQTYYNKYVNFDYAEDEKLEVVTERTETIHTAIITLTKYIAEFMCDLRIASSERATINLRNITFEYGKITILAFGASSHLIGGNRMLLPPIDFENGRAEREICYRYVEFKNNPFILAEGLERVRSKVVVFGASDEFKEEVVIKKLKGDVEVLVPRKDPYTSPIYNVSYNSLLYFVADFYNYGQSKLYFHLELESNTDVLTVYIREEMLPTVEKYDYKIIATNLTVSDIIKVEEVKFNIHSDDRNNSIIHFELIDLPNGTYYIGISISSDKLDDIHFGITPFATSCLSRNNKMWVASNGSINMLTDITHTQCAFDSLTYYSADIVFPKMELYIEPLPIKIIPEPIVKIVGWFPILVLYIIYYFFYSIVKKYDKQDMFSRYQNMLPEHNPEHEHQYTFTIKTGLWLNAGTTSNIGIVFYGAYKNKTVLIKNIDPLFASNASSTFSTSSDDYLGDIAKISIWTDYSGSTPDWFLESVHVRFNSGPTMQDSIPVIRNFKYNKWIGYATHRIGCVLKRENEDDQEKTFKRYWKEKLFNYHMWISFLTKDQRSQPSRFILLMLSISRSILMLLVIIVLVKYFLKEGETFVLLRFNDFFLAILSLLLTLPLFIYLEKLLIYLSSHDYLSKPTDEKSVQSETTKSTQSHCTVSHYFDITEKLDDLDLETASNYSSKEKKNADHPSEIYFDLVDTVNQEIYPMCDITILSVNSADKINDLGAQISQTQSEVSTDDYFDIVQPLISPHNPHGSISPCSQCKKQLGNPMTKKDVYLIHRIIEKIKENAPLLLRWSRKFLVFFIVVTTCVFIVCGYTSSLTVILTIIKCFFLALVLSIFVEQMFIISLLTYWDIRKGKHRGKTFHHGDNTNQDAKKFNNEKVRKVEAPMFFKKLFDYKVRINTISLKIVGYIIFIIIVIILAKRDRQTSNFYLKKSVHATLAGEEFDQINHKDTFWLWLSNTFISSLHMTQGMRTADGSTANYIADGKSIIISISRLRQIRIKRTNCSTDSNQECHTAYNNNMEDQTNYSTGWSEFQNKTDLTFAQQRYLSYWMYQTSSELFGHPLWGKVAWYPGGGYVVPIAANKKTAQKQFQLLQADGWIDELTRAVLIELSVYNPPTGFICTVKLLTEFLATGIAFTSIYSHSFNFFKYSEEIKIQSIILEIIYAAILFFLTVNVIFKFIKSRGSSMHFWRGFWTVLDIITIFSGWLSVFMYWSRSISITRAVTQYIDKPYYYIDFHEAARLDLYFGYCLGMLVFTVTLKIIDLLIVQTRIKILTIIIHNSVMEMVSFGAIFLAILGIFAQVFYLVYGRHSHSFTTAVGAFGSTFSFMMGEVSWDLLMNINPHLTPIFGVSMILVSIMFLMNVFAVIICANVEQTRQTPLDVDSLGIFSFMLKKLTWATMTFMPFLSIIYKSIFKPEGGVVNTVKRISVFMRPSYPNNSKQDINIPQKYRKYKLMQKSDLLDKTKSTEITLSALYEKLCLVDKRLDYLVSKLPGE